MSYRGQRFNNGMRSIEAASGRIDPSKARLLSDDGLGVERIVTAADYRELEESLSACLPELNLLAAELCLAMSGESRLLPTLRLIVENRSEYWRSLEEMPCSTYFKYRGLLLEFFGIVE